MAGAYTATIYDTAAAVVTACEAATATKLAFVVPFMEAGRQKFIVVVAA
jgi:hypothetical protein